MPSTLDAALPIAGGAAVLVVGLIAFCMIPMIKGKRRARSTGVLFPALPAGAAPHAFKPLKLAAKTIISPDTVRLRFELPTAEDTLGLCVGQHIYARIGQTQRPYTPVSPVDQRGYFDLVVKIYRPAAPAFPDGGRFSFQLLDKVEVGQTVEFKPASCKLEYTGGQQFNIKEASGVVPRSARRVLMIAGGTGITPMWQIMQAAHLHATRSGDAVPEIVLLYSNRTEADILLREDLAAMTVARGNKCTICHTLTRPVAGSVAPTMLTGRINVETLRRAGIVPSANSAADDLVLICGPPSMVADTCKPALAALGFPDSCVKVL